MASTITPPLLRLPVELMQRVASFSACSDVLSITRVNRQLREACYDKFEFEQIAKRYHINLGLSSDPWHPENIFDGSLDCAIRLAYSAEQFCKWIESKSLSEMPTRAHRWMPILIFTHYPAMLRLDISELVRIMMGRYAQNPSDLRLFNLPHCLAYMFLSQPTRNRELDDDVSRFDNVALGYRISQAMGFRREDFNDVPHFVSQETCLAIIIGLAITLTSLDDFIGLHHVRVPYPDVSQIPFQSLLEIPPITSTESGRFDFTRQFKTMTSAEFLSGGEWVGVYSDLRWDQPHGPLDIHWGLGRDGPMRGIRFACESVLGGYLGLVTRITGCLGSARDDHGEFDISGEVDEDGVVRLRKQYRTMGFNWAWNGQITPFGIAGVWVSPGYHRIGGYFWIWKRDWCLESSSNEVEGS